MKFKLTDSYYPGWILHGNARMKSSEYQNSPLLLRAHLRGMRPEDVLEVVLPAEYAGLRIGELLEVVFPEDEEARSDLEEMFDLRGEPRPAGYLRRAVGSDEQVEVGRLSSEHLGGQ